MKSLEELAAIRKKALEDIDLRKKGTEKRVVVGMGDLRNFCGSPPGPFRVCR